MDTKHVILGVILFAAATMIIYIWGLKRQMNQSKDLMNLLFSKGEKKVNLYLKNNDSISKKEAEDLLAGLTAKFPFTTAKAAVTDPADFVNRLFAYMEKTGQMQEKNGRYYKE